MTLSAAPEAVPNDQRFLWARAQTNLALADLDANLGDLIRWRSQRGPADTDAEVAALIVRECEQRLEYLRAFAARGVAVSR